MQVPHARTVVHACTTIRLHHVVHFCRADYSRALCAQMAFYDATNVHSELQFMCPMKGHSAQLLHCVSPADSCRYMSKWHRVNFTSAHNGANDSLVEPTKCSGRFTAALSSLQQFTVYLVFILSRNPGALSTALFVHYSTAQYSSTFLRDTSRDVTKNVPTTHGALQMSRKQVTVIEAHLV